MIPALLLQSAPGPAWVGDGEAQIRLEAAMQGALASTEAFGPWPAGPWRVHLHEEASTFERLTGAPPQRAAIWVGDTLHLRPWDQVRRRDLGAVLRHELVHRRLKGAGVRRWEEEARCLWAEGHTHLPEPRPRPSEGLQTRWDRALASGTTREQAWTYAALRAWLRGERIPEPPQRRRASESGWRKGALSLAERVVVRWPENRLPRRLEVNGVVQAWRRGAVHRYEGGVRFGNGPISRLEGAVELRGTAAGWSLRWATTPEAWIAAASVGELQEDAPFEARRALAALLRQWLKGHPKGHHGDGTLCPLTHCAVVRGVASPETLRAANTAPPLNLRPRACFFTGSTGGHRLSPREAWGEPFDEAPPSETVRGDRWAVWTRTLTAARVARLKALVQPGLRQGQKGLMLGPSGPYAVESLRLAAGRAWGWTIWPSNAVEAELQADGSLRVHGWGWGHNVGLDLALARHQAAQGMMAEEILRRAFGADAVK